MKGDFIMGKLREKMKMDLKLKGYSPKTQTAYLGYMKNFARYFGRSPAKMGEEEKRLASSRFCAPEDRILSLFGGFYYIFYRITWSKSDIMGAAQQPQSKDQAQAMSGNTGSCFRSRTAVNRIRKLGGITF